MIRSFLCLFMCVAARVDSFRMPGSARYLHTPPERQVPLSLGGVRVMAPAQDLDEFTDSFDSDIATPRYKRDTSSSSDEIITVSWYVILWFPYAMDCVLRLQTKCGKQGKEIMTVWYESFLPRLPHSFCSSCYPSVVKVRNALLKGTYGTSSLHSMTWVVHWKYGSIGLVPLVWVSVGSRERVTYTAMYVRACIY